MIINPSNSSGAFKFVASNVANTRPSANYGTTVNFTITNKGSWVQLFSGTDISVDCYKIYVSFHSLGTSGTNRSALADIGIDVTGGTSYVPLIEDISASMCSTLLVHGGGVNYTFPIYIPKGSSIAVRGTSAQGSPNGYVRMSVYGNPTNLESLVYGTGAETLGRNGTAIQGTTLTGASAATTSKSSWTLIGTTSQRWKALQVGYGQFTTSATAGTTRLEVGYGSGSDIHVVQPLMIAYSSATEIVGTWQPPCECDIPAGSDIYVRMQSSVSQSNSTFALVTGVY